MGKRANQEGSVYKRQDGRWVASIVLDNGKRKSVYCKTQQEAVKAVKKLTRKKTVVCYSPQRIRRWRHS